MFKAVLRNDDRNIWAANGIGKLHASLVIGKSRGLYARRFLNACVHVFVAGNCIIEFVCTNYYLGEINW